MPAQWTCQTCDKGFQRKGDLTRHQHLHTGYKPHVCTTCGKAFSQFTGLKTHSNVHTREKPFKCAICPATFGDPSSCARHRRETHLNPTGHRCFYPGCKTSIKRRSCFTKHLKEKHGLDISQIKSELEPVEFDELYQMSPEGSPSPSHYSDLSEAGNLPGNEFTSVSLVPELMGDYTLDSSCWGAVAPSAGYGTPEYIPSNLPFSQVDLPGSSNHYSTPFYPSVSPEHLQPTSGCSWAGRYQLTTPPHSLCSSVRSSPAPRTPEHTANYSINEAVDARYANFIPMTSSKDDQTLNFDFPFGFGTTNV